MPRKGLNNVRLSLIILLCLANMTINHDVVGDTTEINSANPHPGDPVLSSCPKAKLILSQYWDKMTIG
ncbi:hypothetical protein TNCV_4003091 [Trichonephila clavipes]|nr:hypothetical protein TNCV_4003091 [Trichonephila clavipes]